ncbi:MAG: pseudouridine synthase [Acutalibacteraceae bacterium]
MKNNTIMRLDKAVCTLSGLSRADAKKAIYRREVSVDGEVIAAPDYHTDFDGKTVDIYGEKYFFQSKIYIMMNKPEGCVCTSVDDERSVLHRLSDKLYRKDLFTVGRLDMDTTGLLIITNDGEFAHKVISPKNHVPKVYIATLAEPITDGQIAALLQGVTLNDGEFVSALEVKPSEDKTSAKITVDCGKYHMVKRMFAAVGNSVDALHRESIGALILPHDLAVGDAVLLPNGEENKAFVQML